jgi:dihydrofolate reductase
MSRLIYSAITSLDGYVADSDGSFAWAAPDEEVHAFINDLERPVGTYLYGRRMYEVMSWWEAVPDLDDEPAVIQDFARIWERASKVVFSRTLASVSTPRTRLEREFSSAWVAEAKSSVGHDLGIGGAEIAGQAIRAGLVDEIHLFVSPVIVGGGSPALPSDVRAGLLLMDVNRFASGTVHLHYGVPAVEC